MQTLEGREHISFETLLNCSHHPFAPHSAPPSHHMARTHGIDFQFCVYTDFLR